MKYLFINAVCGITSTGKICAELAEKLENEGNICKIAFGRESFVPDKYQKYAVRIGNKNDVRIHALSTRIFDNAGFCSYRATKKFLKWADEYNPDILWLHNLHGYYINVRLLFEWIKSRPDMEVKWTLHDCWAFTGHSPYFGVAQCERWKTGCFKCPMKKVFPQSYFFDRSKTNYKQKRELFTGVKKMTIITPSQWMANVVKESYLGEYHIEVINNTVNTEVFYPHQSDIRERLDLRNKKIILGVANGFDEKKGLNDFIELSQLIDVNTVIILIGLRTTKEIERLPANVIGFTRTENQAELSDYYAASDVFFNPTYCDNYPTVNLEAEACGTPVITYDVGGCKETIKLRESMAIRIKDYKTVLKYIDNI